MRGAANLVLIGRAEQVDLAHGLATSYACQNCCPDSFYSAFASDCGVPTYPIDLSQLYATEFAQDCYGATYGYTINDWVFIDWLSYSPDTATVDENGLAEGQSPGTANIRAGWYATTWHFDLVHGYCKSSIAHAIANSTCNVVGLPNVVSISQEIIDESRQGSEVVECGRFKIKVKFKVGCPPPGYTLQLPGHIQEDATLIGAETHEIDNDLETCTYEATELYRMKNRLDQTIGTGFTSYRATVNWSERTATKNGPGISTRATIPGVGPCP